MKSEKWKIRKEFGAEGDPGVALWVATNWAKGYWVNFYTFGEAVAYVDAQTRHAAEPTC